jgi:transcriptional regulator with XRE-family HTH domain
MKHHRFSFERLEAIREERGMSWYGLAKAIDARPTSFTRYQISRTVPSAGRLLDVAEVLGCDIADFFETDGGSPDEAQPDSSSKEKPSRRTNTSAPKTAKSRSS